MLLLTAITDKLQLVTSAAIAVDVHASFVDLSGTTVTPGKQNTAISTATATDIVAAPGASTTRNVQTLTVRNKGAALQTVTVVFDQNGTGFELYKATLNPNDTLQFLDGIGFFVSPDPVLSLYTAAVADQALGTAATYITGSGLLIPANRPIVVGTIARWHVNITKTAASTAAANFLIKFGTAGAVADATIITLTMGAQTAAVDTGFFTIEVTFRGPIGAACIAQGVVSVAHHTGAITGFVNLISPVYQVTSAGFNCTVANSIVGLAATPGASAAWTVKSCSSELRAP